MVGVAIYSFEGIGVEMPIMHRSRNPESFVKVLMIAIGTLTSVYVFFGVICCLAHGSSTNVIITEMLPPSALTTTIKMLFCVNLIFTYSIYIYPTNAIIEGWLLPGPETPGKKWAKNLSRALVCAAAASTAILLEGNLDNFLGILGALLCAPLALTIPTCLHLKVLAKTAGQRALAYCLIGFSMCVLVFCTAQSIRNWK